MKRYHTQGQRDEGRERRRVEKVEGKLSERRERQLLERKRGKRPVPDGGAEAKDSAGIDKNSSMSNVLDSIDKTYGAGAIMKLGGGRVFADGVEVPSLP